MSTAQPRDLAARFPTDFLFGVATAAYQIEGAAEEDGRKPSIWDAFSHTPGRVRGRDTGDVACDHYHRFEEDLSIAADLGVDVYRFSLAWPRIIPDGVGAVNEKGIDFYDRLVDTILAKGLKPYATLYHWDLPINLHGRGGWTSRPTAYAFADFASVAMKRLGDRLAAVTTFNEPWCATILSYLLGIHAPGEKNLAAALHAVHTMNLAHGLAVDAIRAVRSDIPVGIVLNAESIYPGSSASQDVAAARRHHRFHNGLFCDPLFAGTYPEEVVKAAGEDFPKVEPGDMEIICRPIDYLGINYYQPSYIVDAPDLPYPSSRSLPPAEGVPTTAMNWKIIPAGIGNLLSELKRDWKLPPVWIMENGAAFTDTVVDGKVNDQDRVAYYRDHLTAVADLIEKGEDIRGYFAWSLLDNFEWAEGYSCRFGLVHVDYATQKRTLKASGAWYRDLLRRRKAG